MFEVLVRPFQSPPPIASQRIATVVTTGTAPGPAILIWGKAGEVPAGAPIGDETDPYDDISVTIECCKDEFKQRARETETVRIYGKDDVNKTGPFIETQRPKKLEFKKEENECSQGKTPDIVVAPVAGLFLPSGQPVYSVTDNRAKKNCQSTYKYDYGEAPANEEVIG